MSESARSLAPLALLGQRARIPQHVVYRQFPQETVVLNLETGKYHSLNPVGGQMLQALERTESLRQAAAALAQTYPQAATDLIERDLSTFCRALSSRGLIELGE